MNEKEKKVLSDLTELLETDRAQSLIEFFIFSMSYDEIRSHLTTDEIASDFFRVIYFLKESYEILNTEK